MCDRCSKLRCDRLAREHTHLGKRVLGASDLFHFGGERLIIALVHQRSATSIFNRLGDSAMPGREHRHAGRHRFENGIGDSLLVFVRRHLARMQEDVATVVKLQQIFLRQKPGKMNVVAHAQLRSRAPRAPAAAGPCPR